MTTTLVSKIANIARKSRTGEPGSLSAAFRGEFSKAELEALGRLGTSIAVEPGAHLIRQGRHGQEAFVIQRGTAQVLRDDQQVAEIGPGAVVGEGALLAAVPRNASVVAATKMQIYVMSSTEFSAVLAACPRLDAEIRELATDRVVKPVRNSRPAE